MTNDDERVRYLSGDLDAAVGMDEVTRRELDELGDLLADPSLWAEPPEGLEDRVVAAVVAESETQRGAQVVELSAARTTRDSRRRSSPPSWRRPMLVAAAAVVVVAVGVGALLRARGDDDGADLQFSLAPTELIPGAAGTVRAERTDSGWRIDLDATGLPRLDGGRFYQAWLRNADGVLVPIGTFNEGDDVTLWAGVSPRDYPTLTVTEEDADGDQASSGQRVLVGTVDAADVGG